MKQLPQFTDIVKRQITIEQRIDNSIARIPRPLEHLSLEQLRYIVDELNEEVRLVCPRRRPIWY